jgi:hypothetical protein
MAKRVLQTVTLNDIRLNAGRALERGKCCMVLGEPGTGKTTALRHICKANERLAFVTIDMAAKRLVPGLRALAGAVRVYNLSKTSYELYGALCDSIEMGRFSERFDGIVVDEFQNAALDLKRTYLELNDKYRVPLIFAANRTVLKHTRSEVAAFDQIADRISYWLELSGPTRGDIIEFCREYDVDEAAHDWLCNLALPSLRDVDELLEFAREIYPQGKLTGRQLRHALADMPKHEFKSRNTRKDP